MGTEHLIKNAISFITELFADNSDGHDLEHSIRVYKTAMRIADNYNDCNKEIVALAALLHDADDHKLFNTEDNANARKFLAGNDVPTEEINAICEVINSVSFRMQTGLMRLVQLALQGRSHMAVRMEEVLTIP